MRCERQRNGCPVTAKMATNDGAMINLSHRHVHNHEPTPHHSVAIRQFVNAVRLRGIEDNLAPQIIIDQEAHS